MNDRIHLEGVRCRARVGVPDWERKNPQPIELDLTLELDLREAARTDDVRHTADYWVVEQAVRRAVQGPFRLLERLAEEAARAALAASLKVRAVTVRAAKRPAVMPKTGRVVVEIRRARGAR
ncbi:MAG: dihydroneopterin aldolase [Elusimicrobia bacterium]|nr:dihydroneopterin aldolase [Elusimicrobiota bacterium]